MKKIKETSDFAKDPATGALINTNATNLRSYKAARSMRRQLRKLQDKADKADSLELRVAQLEQLVMSMAATKQPKGSKQ